MTRSTHTPEYRHMLKLLRQAREKARLRQIEVADALGKPQSYVSKVENGERRIDPIELRAFARLYRVSALDLLEEIQTVED